MTGEYTTPPIMWRAQRVEHHLEKPIVSFTYRADGSLAECVLALVQAGGMEARPCNASATRLGERIGREYAGDRQLSKMVWSVWDLWGSREWLETLPATYLPGARIMRDRTFEVTVAERKLEACTLVDFSPSWDDKEDRSKTKLPWVCVDRDLRAMICDNTTFYRTLLARRPISAQSREPF